MALSFFAVKTYALMVTEKFNSRKRGSKNER